MRNDSGFAFWRRATSNRVAEDFGLGCASPYESTQREPSEAKIDSLRRGSQDEVEPLHERSDDPSGPTIWHKTMTGSEDYPA